VGRLPAALLVPDDVVQLSLAAIVPADMRIAEGSVLLDQSMLTAGLAGHRFAVGKVAYAG
jgi:H+-transporting ATPase